LLTAKGGSVNAAGGGLMGLAEGGTSEVIVEKEEFIPRDLSQLGGLKGQALRQLQRQKGFDKFGEPLRPEDVSMDSPQAVAKRRKAIEGKYPSPEEQTQNWKRTLRQMPTSPSSMPEIILKNQAKKMVENIKKAETEKTLPIPEGADDELTQEEFLEQITSTQSPIDSDSGWDIEKMMAGFAEGFDEAAPYLASYAKQQGWDDSAEGLKGISEAALKKAQRDYYAGLGIKAEAWEAIEEAKAGRKLTKNRADALMKGLEEELEIIKAKITAEGASTPELDEEVNRIISVMRQLALVSYKGAGTAPDVRPAD